MVYQLDLNIDFLCTWNLKPKSKKSVSDLILSSKKCSLERVNPAISERVMQCSIIHKYVT